jgi:N-acetylglucosaminyldiphosphoundecaprenol N-acetyl-beta-D-mannosaminyltransferase
MTPPNRVSLFGISIDNLTMAEAVESVRRLLEDRNRQHYVATPNVDHIVRLHKDAVFRQAYAGASLVLADGMPLVWASRSLGRPLKMRVTGADLLPGVCEMAAPIGKSVFLLGGLNGVAERAAHNLRARYPGLQVAGVYSPPLGFERDAREQQRIVERINRARPDLLAIGLGSPKQELWIAAHRRQLQFGVALCIGAAIDFAAGVLQRAPQWMQRHGLEWLWRLSRDPRRLWKRYLVDDLAFAKIVAREWWRLRVRAAPATFF